MNRACNCQRTGLGTINPCDDFVGGEIGTQFANNLIEAENAQAVEMQAAQRDQAAERLRKIAPILLALILRG